MSKLAALYARVSTLQQEQEATIDSQVAALEGYAQAQGYSLNRALYFLDQSVSGAQLDRPALNRLRDLAPEGLFEVVLALSPDRLARQYAHQWVLMNELQRVGVKVLFTNQPLLEDSPHSQLLLGVQGLFAEYERAIILERLRRGRLHRIRQGEQVSHMPPYGYRYLPRSQAGGGRWELEPAEAQVVQQIYAWYIQERVGIWDIVGRLNALGPAAPARGQAWAYSTVQAILQRVDYTGQSYYNRTQANYEAVGRRRKVGRGLKCDPQRVPRPKEEWIPMQVPAILAESTWQQAQERLAMQKQFAPRNNARHFYLLRSLLVCEVCGHTLAGRTAGGRKTYRCCYGGTRGSPDVPKHSRVVAAEAIEPLVWQAVVGLLDHPDLLRETWESQVEQAQVPPAEPERLGQRLKTLERQWQRLLDLYQAEQIDQAELLRRKARLDQERHNVQQRFAQLESQLQRERTKEEVLEDFAAYCRQVRSGLDHPTPELQQEIIRLLIDHIVVGESEIVIKHIVPTSDACRLISGHRCMRIFL